MGKTICGIQQVGIGVKNVEESWKWYKDHLGFDTKIFGDEGVAERMLPYTGGKPQPRYAILVMNLRGGGGFEVWEPRGRELNYIEFEPQVGDLGIFGCKVKSPNVDALYTELKAKGLNLLSEPQTNPNNIKHFFVKDPWGNLFDIEEDSYVFINEKKNVGGCNGAILGVTDMDKSIEFYRTITEYDHIDYDVTGVFSDFGNVPGHEYMVRRVMLSRSKPLEGPLCEVMGTSHIELVQRIIPKDSDTSSSVPSPRKLYEGRLWGDPGFIHLCFDIRNMEGVRECAESLGHPFVCDGGRDFDMGDANGHFTYVEDPDGTLIEFVETFKVPILKKYGIFLHLENRDNKKPLPRFMTKALRFLR